MAKSFVIQCPDCGKYLEAKTGLFAKKTVKCICGRVIDIKSEKMTTKICPHCGNEVMYDQSKGFDATCPVCHHKINTEEDLYSLVHFTCPYCSASQTANKNEVTHTCTVCGAVIDVKKRLAEEAFKKSEDISVVKGDIPNNVFVWKHPIEDFKLGSQLIVHASQEAIFFRDGVSYDVLGAGRYTLEKNVIPALNEVYKLPEDSDVAIHTEVYFINKTVQTGILWGTPSKVRIMEPTLNFPVEIGARGSFNLEVCDSKKLVMKLVGTASGLNQKEIVDGGLGYDLEYVRGKFADMIAMNVTSMLARILTENKINLLTVDTMKAEIARLLEVVINKGLLEFGLQIPNGQFYVTDIVTPENDPNYVRMKKQYLASLDLKDDEITKARIISKGDVELTGKQVEAKLAYFDTHTEIDLSKIATQGAVDDTKIMAVGSAEIDKINAQSVAETTKILAGSSADSVVIGAKSEAERIKLEGHAAVAVYRDMAMAEAEALKAKDGDYEKETDRIVGQKLAEKGITINVNLPSGPEKWTCASCGKEGITSNFCPDCGAKKLAKPTKWNCSCGKTNIESNFCPDCGNKRN